MKSTATSQLSQPTGLLSTSCLIPGPTDEVSSSWYRSAVEYRIDPDSRAAPHVVTQNELQAARAPLHALVGNAHEEIEQLYAIVRQADYTVLVSNPLGIIVDHRGNDPMAEWWKHRGAWSGAVWSEEVEGTNGIGTCLVEQRPVSIHREQHFRTRHAELSCAAAPIFDASGRLAAVLDSTSVSPAIADRSHVLALAATATTARAIEERLFREHFRHSWIVAAAPCDEGRPRVLLAVDADRCIVGADRVARSLCALDDKRLEAGVGLSAIFVLDGSFLLRGGRGDVRTELMRSGSHERWDALITPPDRSSRRRRHSGDSAVHARPRIGTLAARPTLTSSTPSSGGLAPGLTRRIREYIESHLDENIGLEALASTAGLSVHHFARAFRQSVGEPPHTYVVRRRVERARRMLEETDLPLSDIGLAVGFSDHSHFARHFRRLMGMTPRAARWQKR